MKKVSIAIPTGGDDYERRRNLEECLHCLSRQTVAPHEVIIVEQSLDGSFYNDDLPCDKHVKIADPENRGFNLAWCRNVGAYAASGDVVLLMDGDYVFADNYLEQIQKVDAPFFSGAKSLLWSDENLVRRYLQDRNFDVMKSCRRKLVPFVRGVANGGIIGFNRGWYINHFVGYCENFFNYGYEDNESIDRITKLLNKNLKQLTTADAVICHLEHQHRVVSPGTNAGLYQSLVTVDFRTRTELLKSSRTVGNVEAPTLISVDTLTGTNAEHRPTRTKRAPKRGRIPRRSSQIINTATNEIEKEGSKTNELFTILIPNFNKVKYLDECIASVVAQTTDKWRCIIVDDGSSDGSVEVLQNNESLQDKRFRVFYNKENMGNATCLNQMVDLAESDIVGILDSDDVLEPTCIEKVLKFYAESYKGFVYTNFRYCNEKLQKKGLGYCRSIPRGKTALELDCVSAFRTFRVSEYLKTEGVDQSLSSAIDKDLIYKMEEVTTLHFLNEPLYLYRMLKDSLSIGRVKQKTARRNHDNVKSVARERRAKSKSAQTLVQKPVANAGPKIHTYIAYAQTGDKNLGAEYNKICSMVPEDDWICFLDHDAMFTTKYWYKQLTDIVEKHPEVGMFTAMTNRVYNKVQLYRGRINDDHNIHFHRKVGNALYDSYYDVVQPLSRQELLSGVLMLIKKSVWSKHKFEEGFLGVDNRIHSDLLDANYPVMLMKGVYVYHWYRGDGDKSHLSGTKQVSVSKSI